MIPQNNANPFAPPVMQPAIILIDVKANVIIINISIMVFAKVPVLPLYLLII